MDVIDGDTDCAFEDLQLAWPAHERAAGHAIASRKVPATTTGASPLVCSVVVAGRLRHDGRIVFGIGVMGGVGALLLAGE